MEWAEVAPTRGSVRRLYATIWRHAGGYRARIVLFATLLVAAQAVRLTIPWFFGQAVNALQQQGLQDIGAASRYLLLMLAAVGAAWTMHGPARILERLTALAVRERFADAVYAKAISLPLQWHEQHHSGETIHRMTKASASLAGFAGHQFVYLQNTVSIVGPILALCLLSPLTGAAALVGYATIGLFVVRIDEVMVRLVREENRAERRYNATLTDAFGNVATVLTLGLQEATRRLAASRLLAVFAPLRRSIVFNEVKWGGVDLMNNALRTGLVALYGWMTWREHGFIAVGTAVMVHQYSQQIGTVVGALAIHWNELVRQKTDVAGTDEILCAATRPGDGADIAAGWRELRIDDLRLVHPTAPPGRVALDDVSLCLRRGRRVGLVGESGSGKTSLLRILAGLVEAERVTFTVDGVARPDVRSAASIALLLPQDPEVFEASVLSNLTLGVPRELSEVERACDVAGFTAVLRDLPQGLETAISERGFNLSGGQKQRLALARGLLAARGSSLVLLDEPTSSVDVATEAAILDRVLGAFAGACVVLSVHRLHLLARCDEVVFLEHGRVVDAGTPAELVARQPSFARLWRAQLGPVEEERRPPTAA